MTEYSAQNPKPAPEGCEILDEIVMEGGKYRLRLLRFTDSAGKPIQRWQALRYGDDWPACPYGAWAPDNLELNMFFRIVSLEDKLREFTKTENYAAGGRFNPENGAFDAISFATFAIEGKDYT